MTTNNTIEGIHLFPVNGELLYKPKAKKYYWHIPKALQDKNIQVNSVVRGNKKQIVLVTKVFQEDFLKEQPTIREATKEEAKQLNAKKTRE